MSQVRDGLRLTALPSGNLCALNPDLLAYDVNMLGYDNNFENVVNLACLVVSDEAVVFNI